VADRIKPQMEGDKLVNFIQEMIQTYQNIRTAFLEGKDNETINTPFEVKNL
jgi:hypothetical protein